MTVHSPATIHEIQEIIAQSFRERRPVYPQGGMTQQHWLAPATVPGSLLDMRAIQQVVDYPFQDMTITVHAGMTVQRLKQMLKEQKQCLPIDVPDESTATIGGSIAANIAGPRAASSGSWRDYLIGLSWINYQGSIVKAGGRVVKNVAGYDFCKLFIGSLGTLGVITEVTLKVKPQPEKLSVMAVDIPLIDCQPFQQWLSQSSVRPALSIWCSGDMSRFWIGFEDNAQAVNWQVQQVLQAAEKLPHTVQMFEQEQAEQSIWKIINGSLTPDAVCFTVKYPRAHTFTLTNQLTGIVSAMQVQPQTGLIHGSLEGLISEVRAVEIIERIRALASDHGGYVSITRCPAAWRERLFPFGKPQPAWKLMRKIKKALDPHDLFQRNRHEIFLGE